MCVFLFIQACTNVYARVFRGAKLIAQAFGQRPWETLENATPHAQGHNLTHVLAFWLRPKPAVLLWGV